VRERERERERERKRGGAETRHRGRNYETRRNYGMMHRDDTDKSIISGGEFFLLSSLPLPPAHFF